jgi:hypothetical protein
MTMNHRHHVIGVALLGAAMVATMTASSSAASLWRHATSMCRSTFDTTADKTSWSGSGALDLVAWPRRDVVDVECGGDNVISDGVFVIHAVDDSQNMRLSCTARLQNEDGSVIWTASNSIIGPGRMVQNMFYFPPANTYGHFSARCSLPSLDGSQLFEHVGYLTSLNF